MRCRLMYRHPVTRNVYYFVDYRRSGDGDLRPVGCFPYRVRFATIFETKRDAMAVALDLTSNGYQAVKVVKANA